MTDPSSLPSAITLDLETTWPSDLLAILAEHEAIFTDYENTECALKARYDKEHKAGHYTPMALRDSNPHYHLRQYALNQVEAVLQQHRIKGWHCTRLTEAEQNAVLSDGLLLSSPEFLLTRIAALEAQGLIPAAVAKAYINTNRAGDQGRPGKVWFVMDAPATAGESGVGGFFRFWGGESLYADHDTHQQRGRYLRNVGQACIIEAEMPVAMLRQRGFLPEKMTRMYVMRRGVTVLEKNNEHEDYIEAVLPASSVVRIIRHPDPEFLQLTGCTDWDDKIT